MLPPEVGRTHNLDPPAHYQLRQHKARAAMGWARRVVKAPLPQLQASWSLQLCGRCKKHGLARVQSPLPYLQQTLSMLMVVPQLLLQNPHFVITTNMISLAVFLPDTQWSVLSN
jgi:hypothetical protein